MQNEEPMSGRKWEPMRLTPLGKVGDVVRKAIGKSPTLAGDSGEPDRKPPGGPG